jgi:regulator of sirC expression with transglutaminase-like and TPR domain
MRRNRSYEKATFYDNPEAYSVEAAAEAYRAFLRLFPDAPQAETVRKRLAELSLSLSTSKQ